MWPAGPSREPQNQQNKAVVFVHGGGVIARRAVFTGLPQGLADEGGVALLRYDLRGQGQRRAAGDSPLPSTSMNGFPVALTW